MNELIKVEETTISSETAMENVNTALVPVFNADLGQGEVNAVNARELHEYLENGDKYSTWIKDRIERYNFLEGQDFLSFSEKAEKAGRPRTEYYVSLDMAKELCMVERNEKGREARKYFIECEKKLRQVLSTEDALILGVIRADDIESRMLAMSDYRNTIVVPLQNKVQEQAVVIEEQTQVIEKAKPKVEFYDTVTMTTDTVDLADAAKLLNFQGVGRNTLYKLLRQWKVIDSDNRPYQKYVNIGCFKLVQYTVPGPYGNTRVKFKTVCYQKGLDLLLRMLIKKGYQRL